jgi:tetratricopeptide (TPR) repeat protein
MQDIFALQDEITEAIVASMHPELVHLESERVARTDPRSLDAYECFLRGTWHLGQRTREHSAAARKWFEKATEFDPQLAEGWVGIAATHNLDVAYHWTDEPERSIAEQNRAARKGVALDARSPDGQVELGWGYVRTGHREAGIGAFERAIALDPSHAPAHAALGVMLALGGRSDDASESLEKAMRLNPRSPRLWYWLDGMAWAHFAGGRYEDAIEWAQRSCKVNPDQPWAYRALAASHALLNRAEEARWALKEELRLEPDITIQRILLEMPWADPDFLERYLDGLRKAGLPE